MQGRSVTAATTARVALELDLAQYEAVDGPCVRSLRTATSVRIDLVESGDEVPHFAVGAAREGANAVLSLPPVLHGEAVGTLNLYSRSGPFDDDDEQAGRVPAAQVAIAVAWSEQLVASRELVDQAQRDADDAAEVSLATGLLAERERCTVSQAEGIIQGAARRQEQSLASIARRILAEHHRPV